jgi:hypothetical protein
MFIAVATLFVQFSVFFPGNIQAAEKTTATLAAKAADDASVSSKSESASVSQEREVLSAENSADPGVPVAFAPGRLVAAPIVATTPAPAAAVANPASPVAIEPGPIVPVYGPAYSRIYGPPIRAVSDRRQSREWLALSFAAHSAAGFDAWSTRRVISSVPNAQEMNPFLRPFAGNASMYAAVQVLPTVLDFVSRRMMNSRNEFLRHTWWLPQAVSAVVSVSSGVHNMGVYNSR